MEYNLTDKEFQVLATHWSTSLYTTDPHKKWEALQRLETLAIACRGTVEEIIDEYGCPAWIPELDPDERQPYSCTVDDDLSDCPVSQYGYN